MPTDVEAPAEAQDAVRVLYRLHARALHVALRRLAGSGADVDDLLHEVFVIALRRNRALLRAESPKAWLYGVAARVAASAGRKQRLREWLGLRARAELSVPARSLVSEQYEAAAVVHRALSRLSTRKREVLVLFELQGLSGPEIAQALGCSLKTVWSRLHYARRDFEREVAADD